MVAANTIQNMAVSSDDHASASATRPSRQVRGTTCSA
jgi:hypothetical protein